MIEVTDRTFSRVRIVDPESDVGQVRFVRSTFEDCAILQDPSAPLERAVRNFVVEDCTASECRAHTVLFDEVTVSNLITRRPVELYGCALRHVVLRGKIGGIYVRPPHIGDEPDEARAAVEAAIALYRDVDWALDIREAILKESDLQYVPGDLVIRDPETQFLLRRSLLAGADYETLPVNGKLAALQLDSSPFDSIVMAPPTKKADHAEFLSDMASLRSMGLAE